MGGGGPLEDKRIKELILGGNNEKIAKRQSNWEGEARGRCWRGGNMTVTFLEKLVFYEEMCLDSYLT